MKKTQIANVREQLFLISIIVLFSGLVFIDSYYQRFGLKHQITDFSVTHIAYKGLIMIKFYWWIIIPYALTAGFSWFEIVAIRSDWKGLLDLRIPIMYIFLFVVFSTVYYIADKAGMRRAQLDLSSETSELPVIDEIVSKQLTYYDGKKNYLLFLDSKDYIIVFESIDLKRGEDNTVPTILRIPRQEIFEIRTSINFNH